MAKCKKCGAHGLMTKVNADGLCLFCVTEKYAYLNALLTPELRQITDAQKELDKIAGKRKAAESAILEAKTEEKECRDRIKELRSELIGVSDLVELESFSLYRPRYEFANSDEYKVKLDEIRDRQKDLIKREKAATCSTVWTVSGSTAKGRAFTKEIIKLFLRSFNNECDIAISGVKFSNYERCEARIRKSFDTINKLGKTNDVTLEPDYLQLKLDELALAYEYQVKKQEEKEAAAELRAQQREEARIAKEIEAARKEAEKERKHYVQALEKLSEQMRASPDDPALVEKKKDLMTHLDDIEGKLEDIDYRQSNQRAGYVYIISNVGSFGESVYKIGMTRRLDPMERVYELGDASVPFRFDVHAMIFTEDAPKLEAALHQAFADKRINMVNPRREYFRVSLEEIKRVVRENHDKTVEFVDVPEAQQYRESLLMQA